VDDYLHQNRSFVAPMQSQHQLNGSAPNMVWRRIVDDNKTRRIRVNVTKVSDDGMLGPVL
jgi:hypothetical protein